MTGSKYKSEISAIEQITSALEPLEQEARVRVFKYCANVFGITVESTDAEFSASDDDTSDQKAEAVPQRKIVPQNTQYSDIRTFAEAKQAKKDIERAAVIAYFLSQVAQGSDKKESIGTQDVKDYFIQAGYALPSEARFTFPRRPEPQR